MGDAWHRAKVQSPPSASLVCRASCRASSARNFGPAELASPLGKIEDARRRNRLKCHNNPAVTSASPELRRLRNFPRDFLSLATPRPFPVPLVPSAILILRKPIRSSRKKKRCRVLDIPTNFGVKVSHAFVRDGVAVYEHRVLG